MALRLAIQEAPQKTYATRDNAVRALDNACRAISLHTINYLIGTTEDGRFYPVFLPTQDQIDIAVTLARRGFASVRV